VYEWPGTLVEGYTIMYWPSVGTGDYVAARSDRNAPRDAVSQYVRLHHIAIYTILPSKATLALLLVFGSMGFMRGTCNDEPDPICDPPCYDNNGQLCIKISRNQECDNCYCGLGTLQLFIQDENNNLVKAASWPLTMSRDGPNLFVCTDDGRSRTLPTCRVLNVVIFFVCDPAICDRTYQVGKAVIMLDCNQRKTIWFDISCVMYA
jgi:hypothetical protein